MKKTRIAAIDVGKAKVCNIIGTLDGSSGLRMLGVGIAPSRGLEKGLEPMLPKLKNQSVIKDTEIMAGYKLE